MSETLTVDQEFELLFSSVRQYASEQGLSSADCKTIFNAGLAARHQFIPAITDAAWAKAPRAIAATI